MKRLRQYKTPNMTLCIDIHLDKEVYVFRKQTAEREWCVPNLNKAEAFDLFHKELDAELKAAA
jgi:hypothetical protein